MSYQIYLNGIYIDEKRAHVSVADRAFLVGEGLFETLRAYQGNVVFLGEHLKRMQEGAALLGIKLPISLARLEFFIYETMHINRLTDAVIRIYMTPEGSSIGDLDSPPTRVNLLISCRSFEPFSSEYYQSGVDCIIVKGIYAEKGLLAQLKSTNYLSRVLARRQARSQGAFEGILLNPEGHVTEGSGSNLFIVRQDSLFTPPLEESLLAGVTRNQIFKIAEREQIPIQQKILLPSDLYKADEVFITSTLKEVMPVALIDGKQPRLGSPGPLTKRMMEAYHDWVQWQVEGEF
jgi:branched-chain amino acid aminotransferase